MKNIVIKKSIGMYGKMEKARFPFIYLCLLFPVCQFLVFFVYIHFDSILLAFQTPNGELTLNNFKEVFAALRNTDFYGFVVGDALKHSVILWLFTKIIIYPISIISTYVLFKKVLGHYFFRICFMLPSIIGAVIWISVLKYMASPNGPILTLFELMNIEVAPLVQSEGLLGSKDTAFTTMVVFTTVGVVGGDVVLTGAFSRIPTEIFESAKLDGAGFWRECLQIAVPCVGPTISTIVTFSLCSVFVADCNVFLYTNGSGEPNCATMGFYFYYLQVKVSTAVGKTGYSYPAALGVIVSILTVPFVLFGKYVLEKAFPPIEF